MREIVFKGKRIDNDEWVEGSYCHAEKLDRSGDEHFIIEYSANDSSYRVRPETVGQYTGKVVKTGKVFDGDIGKSIDGIFLVCWDDEKAAFVMRFNEYPYETLYLEEMWDDAEIIGNIHDNGELLEVR